PSSVTNSFQRAGSARKDGSVSGESVRCRSGPAPANDAGSTRPSTRMRKPAVNGPSVTPKLRPACATSFSRAHGARSSARLNAPAPNVSGPIATVVLGVLLDAGQAPAGRSIDRLHQVPHFVERLGRGLAILARETLEAHAGPVLVAFGRDLE